MLGSGWAEIRLAGHVLAESILGGSLPHIRPFKLYRFSMDSGHSGLFCPCAAPFIKKQRLDISKQ